MKGYDIGLISTTTIGVRKYLKDCLLKILIIVKKTDIIKDNYKGVIMRRGSPRWAFIVKTEKRKTIITKYLTTGTNE